MGHGMFLTHDNKIKWQWIGWGAILTTVLVVSGIAWFDKPVYLFLRQFDCWLWRLFDLIFDAKMWIIVSFIVLLVFYIKKSIKSKPRYRNSKNQPSLMACFNDAFDKTRNSYAFYVLCSVLAASIVGKLLKIVIGRMRPVFFEALDKTGFVPFSTDWAFNSMPSGHTFASFAGLVMLGLLAPKIKWFTWTLAIIIGVSRVCVGAHWPSDVIFGAFIGMVAADLVKAGLRYYNSDREDK